jgi:hypothetical protein
VDAVAKIPIHCAYCRRDAALRYSAIWTFGVVRDRDALDRADAQLAARGARIDT